MKYEGRIPKDEVLASRLTPKEMSEASSTLNACLPAGPRFQSAEHKPLQSFAHPCAKGAELITSSFVPRPSYFHMSLLSRAGVDISRACFIMGS